MADRQRFDTFRAYRDYARSLALAPLREEPISSKQDLSVYCKPTDAEKPLFEATVRQITDRTQPKRREVIPELQSLDTYGANSVLFLLAGMPEKLLGDKPDEMRTRVGRAMLRQGVSSIQDLHLRVDRVRYMSGPLAGSIIQTLKERAKEIIEGPNPNPNA